jgi:rare lipoprotein A
LSGLVVWVSGCAVVGYPAGRPDGPGTPPPAQRAPSGDEVATGAGREYEVRGVVYRVLDSSLGYDEEGLASWYGAEFQGRRTSSGESYDMDLLTAAHRSLPLQTWVEVTNLDNGTSVVVRVNDRGPFHADRIIDLSRAAARQLGYEEAGTARVRVRALERPPG